MDLDVERLMKLLPVAGEATKEALINETLRSILSEMGVPEDCMENDETHKQSEYGGETGNLIVRLDGHGRGQRRMLSTHMDTVPGCVGCRPRIEGDRIINEDREKALGGDARAGCACVLAAARDLMAKRGDHAPRTLVFFVQEELGLVGSRGMDTSRLGDPLPEMCFNFDGGDPAEIAKAVIGTERVHIDITGVAAHASRPARGISAAVIAAEALAELQREGWNSRITRPEGTGTANLGILRGGTGSNVVMPDLYAFAEGRSFDREFRSRIVGVWKETFQRAVDRANERAEQTEGRARVEFRSGPVYDPYRLAEDDPVVHTAVEAVEKYGMTPVLVDHEGGQDCNHIVAKGIPAVGMGMGDYDAHSVREWVNVPEFLKACQLAVDLAVEE